MNSTEKPSAWSRQAVRLTAPLAMLAMVLSGCSQAPAPSPAPVAQSGAESSADSGELLERYLSVAPYESQTHDCHFHSLTTCLGELQNADVIVDFTTNDGTKVLDGKKLATNDNGFVGLWLPSGVTGELTITADGKTSMQSISTAGSEDATCLTTMQVA